MSCDQPPRPPFLTRLFAVLILVGAVSAAVQFAPPAAPPPSSIPLGGRWEVVSVGQQHDVSTFMRVVWLITADHITVIGPGHVQISRNRYTLDASADPPILVSDIGDDMPSETRCHHVAIRGTRVKLTDCDDATFTIVLRRLWHP